jgi:hypothetical protein
MNNKRSNDGELNETASKKQKIEQSDVTTGGFCDISYWFCLPTFDDGHDSSVDTRDYELDAKNAIDAYNAACSKLTTYVDKNKQLNKSMDQILVNLSLLDVGISAGRSGISRKQSEVSGNNCAEHAERLNKELNELKEALREAEKLGESDLVLYEVYCKQKSANRHLFLDVYRTAQPFYDPELLFHPKVSVETKLALSGAKAKFDNMRCD